MSINYFIDEFKANSEKSAIVWNDKFYNYTQLLSKMNCAYKFIKENDIHSGDVVALIADFTPNSIALLLSLIKNKNIIVPLCSPFRESDSEKIKIAQVEKIISVNIDSDEYRFEKNSVQAKHIFFNELRKNDASGLVLFTSGTSGTPKAAVHDFSKLLKKFETKRKAFRTINFLLWDHWGGLNTLFHTLSNGGVVLPSKNRQPEEICQFIEKYKIDLLPVSPTFLNLLILSEAYKKYDMSSLKLITYGTEPMPITTLKRSRVIFPDVKFQQTYGLIELGVLRSKSKSNDSLWVKIGGEGF